MSQTQFLFWVGSLQGLILIWIFWPIGTQITVRLYSASYLKWGLQHVSGEGKKNNASVWHIVTLKMCVSSQNQPKGGSLNTGTFQFSEVNDQPFSRLVQTCDLWTCAMERTEPLQTSTVHSFLFYRLRNRKLEQDDQASKSSGIWAGPKSFMPLTKKHEK